MSARAIPSMEDELRVKTALAALDRYAKARADIRAERFIESEPVAFKVLRRAIEAQAYCNLIVLLCAGAAAQKDKSSPRPDER